MKLYNNTPMQTFYGISDGTSADCGNIDANESVDLSYFDNKKSVTVTFTAVGTAPPGETPPFSVTIPQSGTGTAVTIGLYRE
ncbi:MAG: hypothetical protein QOH88_1465 [Verrucomicrobiota bacterium]|jgi:hypothetical protein